MEQQKDTTLQHIAEKALSESVVRLELWSPASYHEYVIAFDVDNPTQYDNVELVDQPSNKRKTIIQELMSHASGFFVDKNTIVTNLHVVQGASSITAELVDKQERFEIDNVETFDIENDLILLRVNGEGEPLTIGNSTEIMSEDVICVAGYPNGNAEITQGAIDGISSSNQRIRMRINTTGGSSGSPIFNSDGVTIGIDVSGNEVYSYAIPSNILTELINVQRESLSLKEWQKLPHIRAFAEKKEGDKLQKEGAYKKAIAHYNTAIQLKPDMVKAYEKRSDAKMELGAFGGAIEDLLTIARLQPPVHFRFSKLTKYVSWKVDWVKIIGIHLFIKLLGFIFGNCGWYKFKAHVKIGRAKSEAEKGDKSKAKLLYQEALYDFVVHLSLKPKVARNYNSRGWTKYLIGQLETEENNETKAQQLYQETISDADVALQLHTKNSKYKAAYYHTRGAAKAGIGDHDGAIKDFNECIRLRPKKALFYHDRGLSKRAIGLQTEAKSDFTKAKELDQKIEK